MLPVSYPVPYTGTYIDCSTYVQDVTDLNAYVHLLKTNSSLALCDLTMKNFVVQDFSIDNKQLKVSSF